MLSDPKSAVFRKLGGKICPYLVLIDEHGNIINKHVGYNSGDEIKLEEEIKNLIKDIEKDSTINDSILIINPIKETTPLEKSDSLEVPIKE